MVVPLPVEPVSGPRVVLFGKLPSHGDFVARGLDGRARAAVDDWLSRAVALAVEHRQDGFAAAHDVAPVWRFVAEDAILGPGWTAGAVAPSVDRAGRRFFILLAAVGLTPADAGAHGRGLAEAMEALIYEAVSQTLDADGLHGLAALRAEQTVRETAPPASAAQAWWVEGMDGGPALQQHGRPLDLILSEQAAWLTEGVA